MGMSKLIASVEILRPHLALMAGICALSSWLYLADPPIFSQGFLLFLSVFLISAGTMPLNDVIDLSADRINRPQRPLPSGRLRISEAIVLFTVTSGTGLLAAWLINGRAGMWALLIFLLAGFYNIKGKKWGLWGNIMVSASVMSTFVMGTLAADRSASPLLVYAMFLGFLISLTLETAGDLLDEAGDRKTYGSSFAIRWGVRRVKGFYGALVLLFGLLALGIPLMIEEIPKTATWIMIGPVLGYTLLSAGFLCVTKQNETNRKKGTAIILGQALLMTLSLAVIFFLPA